MTIHINLLREAQAREIERQRDPFKLAMLGLLLVAIGLVGYYLFRSGEVRSLKAERARLESEWQRKEPLMEEAEARQAEIRAVIAEADALRSLARDRFFWSAFLASLTNQVPANASLTSLNGNVSEKREVSGALSGVIAAGSPRQAAEELRRTFQRVLEDAYPRARVVLASLEDQPDTYVIDGSELPSVRFSMEYDIQLDEEPGGEA